MPPSSRMSNSAWRIPPAPAPITPSVFRAAPLHDWPISATCASFDAVVVPDRLTETAAAFRVADDFRRIAQSYFALFASGFRDEAAKARILDAMNSVEESIKEEGIALKLRSILDAMNQILVAVRNLKDMTRYGLTQPLAEPSVDDTSRGLGSPADNILIGRLIRIGDIFTPNTRFDEWSRLYDVLNEQFGTETAETLQQLRKGILSLFGTGLPVAAEAARVARTVRSDPLDDYKLRSVPRMMGNFVYMAAFAVGRGIDKTSTAFYREQFVSEFQSFGSLIAAAYVQLVPNYVHSPPLSRRKEDPEPESPQEVFPWRHESQYNASIEGSFRF